MSIGNIVRPLEGQVELSSSSLSLNGVSGLKAVKSKNGVQSENSEIGSIEARDRIELTDTCASRVISSMGKIEWKNKKQGAEAQLIQARSSVDLLNINCKEVLVSEGDVLAEKSTLGKVEAVKSVRLVQTLADKIILRVNQNSPGNIVLDRSQIKGNVVIVPISDSDFSHAAIREPCDICIEKGFYLEASGNSFRVRIDNPEILKKYKSIFNGTLWEGARGYYNDKPCVFSQGKLVRVDKEADAKEKQEAVLHVTIDGGQVDGDVVFEGCKGVVSLQNQASLRGRIVFNKLVSAKK